MQEKKYLKWYNKLGYGSGDWAANMVSALKGENFSHKNY